MEVLDCLLPFVEGRLLSPHLESFNGFAFVWVLGCLLCLAFAVLFGCLLVLLLGLFGRLGNEGKLLVGEVKKGDCDWVPLLPEVALAVGLDGDALLLHEHQSFGIEVNFLLGVV